MMFKVNRRTNDEASFYKLKEAMRAFMDSNGQKSQGSMGAEMNRVPGAKYVQQGKFGQTDSWFDPATAGYDHIQYRDGDFELTIHLNKNNFTEAQKNELEIMLDNAEVGEVLVLDEE